MEYKIIAQINELANGEKKKIVYNDQEILFNDVSCDGGSLADSFEKDI